MVKELFDFIKDILIDILAKIPAVVSFANNLLSIGEKIRRKKKVCT